MRESKFFPPPPPVDPPCVPALFLQAVNRPPVRQVGCHQSGGKPKLLRHPADAAAAFVQFRNLPAPLRCPQSAGDQDLPDLRCAQPDPVNFTKLPPERLQRRMQRFPSRLPALPARPAVLFPVVVGMNGCSI